MARSDLIANVLLAVPIGFFVMGSLTLDRRGLGARPRARLLTLITGGLAGAAVRVPADLRQQPRRLAARRVRAGAGHADRLERLVAARPDDDGLAEGVSRARRAGLPAGLQRLRAILAIYAAALAWSRCCSPWTSRSSPVEIWHKARGRRDQPGAVRGPFISWPGSVWDVISGHASRVACASDRGQPGRQEAPGVRPGGWGCCSCRLPNSFKFL